MSPASCFSEAAMVIRFTKFTQHANVQHQADDVLDLHEDLANTHIDNGNAVPHDQSAEAPQYETAAFFPNTPSHRGRGVSGKPKSKGKGK